MDGERRSPSDYGGQHSVAYDWATKPGHLAGDVVEIRDPNNMDGCDPIDACRKAAVAGKVVFLSGRTTALSAGAAQPSVWERGAAAGAIGVIFGEDEETFWPASRAARSSRSSRS